METMNLHFYVANKTYQIKADYVPEFLDLIEKFHNRKHVVLSDSDRNLTYEFVRSAFVFNEGTPHPEHIASCVLNDLILKLDSYFTSALNTEKSFLEDGSFKRVTVIGTGYLEYIMLFCIYPINETPTYKDKKSLSPLTYMQKLHYRYQCSIL